MSAIPRSADDLIIDAIVTALADFSAAQELEEPGVAFAVERDRVRPPAMRDMPLVVVWLDTLNTKGSGSSARTVQQETARINVDCYAKGVGADLDDLVDEAAMKRLYYLKEQVKAGLYALINADFGFDPGVIARKSWPSWQTFQNELRLPETEVVAGRWTLELEYNWRPEAIAGVPLDQIAVDVERWSAAYNYEE